MCRVLALGGHVSRLQKFSDCMAILDSGGRSVKSDHGLQHAESHSFEYSRNWFRSLLCPDPI